LLKGVDPVLTGDLLKVLDDMGHGDQLVLADRNYPAVSSGRPVIRLGEIGILRAAAAILTVLPLDTFIDHPLERMEVDGDPAIVSDLQRDLLTLAQGFHEPKLEFGVVPRLDFYERARGAFAVVHTLEPKAFGCFILHKGVVFDRP
jgi:L-fucose mutarotase